MHDQTTIKFVTDFPAEVLDVRFEVLTAVLMKTRVFKYMMLCPTDTCSTYWSFGGDCCLNLPALSSPRTNNLSSLIFFNLTKLRGLSYNLPLLIVLYNDDLSAEKFNGQREYYLYDKLWTWRRSCQDSRTEGRVSKPHEGESKVILLHAMKAYVGMEIQLCSFLTSALDGGGSFLF